VTLDHKKIGIFIADNFQVLDFWYPYLRLKGEGYHLTIIGPEQKTYQTKLGNEVTAKVAAKEVIKQKFDAIVIPGGYAPDAMRVCEPMLHIVKTTYDHGGIIAAICHAIWVPISAKIISGKKATSYHTIKNDVINAGAKYFDQSV
jgi:protease I